MDMKTGLLAFVVIVSAFILVPRAYADPITFHFSGAGTSGSVSLTVAPDTVSGDPGGAYTMTNASGTFSDSNIGISSASITGLAALDPVSPPRGASVPASLSVLQVTNPPQEDAETGGLTYDNLFFPDGSPADCPDYPFAGGFLDVYGAMFTLDNNDIVDLWSDGEGPGMPLIYGAGVIDADSTVIDYQFGGISVAVPEPGFLWLFGAALAGFFAWRRYRSCDRKYG
jgi:hypothetical protein